MGGWWGVCLVRVITGERVCNPLTFFFPLGDSLGANSYWAAGLHLYTPLPFRPGRGGLGDRLRTHFFVNGGNIASLDLSKFSCARFNWKDSWDQTILITMLYSFDTDENGKFKSC